MGYRYTSSFYPKLLLTIVCIFIHSLSFGADVSIGWKFIFPVISINGPIKKGDLYKIQKTTADLILHPPEEMEFRPVEWELNTPGGDIEEAIKIGRFARELLVSISCDGNWIIAPTSESERNTRRSKFKKDIFVELDADAPLTDKYLIRNYGAGVLIFYGGVVHRAGVNIDGRLGDSKRKYIPVIGVYRPYINKEAYSKLSPKEASESYKALDMLVRNYLKDMGAPQTFIDRMFKSSSSKIDLISKDEFDKYYNETEPFLEEWLIAKCGSTGDYSGILTPKENDDFKKILDFQASSFARDPGKFDKPRNYVFPMREYDDMYIKELMTKVRKYNGKVLNCRDDAVIGHQIGWAMKYVARSRSSGK